MAEIFCSIGSWLIRGYNLAVDAVKWIWAEAMAIFKITVDVLASVTRRVQAYLSYSRERTWRRENGTVVEVC